MPLPLPEAVLVARLVLPRPGTEGRPCHAPTRAGEHLARIRGRPAAGRVGVHQAEDQFGDRRREVRRPADVEPLGQPLPQWARMRRLGDEVGRAAGHQETDAGAEAVVVVRLDGRVCTAHLLGCGEPRGARAPRNPVLLTADHGELKVDQAQLAVRAHHDVCSG